MTLTPLRIRGYTATGTVSATVGYATPVGPQYTGRKMEIGVQLTSSSSGVAVVTGVIAYPATDNGVSEPVIGHFEPVSVNVTAGGTPTAVLSSDSTISTIYADQNLLVGFSGSNNLSTVAIGTPFSQVGADTQTFVYMNKGTVFTEPWFIPVAVGAGGLTLVGLAVVAFRR